MHDVIIVGGGIVGLATALQILNQKPQLKILVLEKEKGVARHQTGNNSNVIHSGIYYKPGSLKATNCIHGYNLLLDFCNKNEISYAICGKIIVATDKLELPVMQTIYERGKQNGLQNIRLLRAEELQEHEPHVAGIAGIYVPQTGIVDYRIVAEKFAQNILKKGGSIKFGETVTDVKNKSSSGLSVITQNGTYPARMMVNCGGLYSDKIARLTSTQVDLKIIPFRGEYYKLKKEKEHLVKTLIYPVPDPNFPFLGVHFTTMIGGGVECGPNAVLAFKREGYKKTDINVAELAETIAWPGFRKVVSKYWRTGLGEIYRSYSKTAFTKALQRLIPEIQEDDLVEGGAGVRAQACDRTGGLVDDFVILEEKAAINVCNAPSPAATSALSIGETVGGLVLKRLS